MIPVQNLIFQQNRRLLDLGKFNWPIIAILLFTVMIRLYGITNPLNDYIAWRQTETAAIAANYYKDHLPFLYPEIDWAGPHGHAEMEFPLFPYLISLLYRLFGQVDCLGRILAVICSAGVAWAVYDIGCRLLNIRTGLLAAVFFAVSPLAIFFGRTFQPDMMMVCFSTVSLALLLRWTGTIWDRWYWFSAAALMAGILLKPPCLIVMLPMLWIFFRQAQRGWIVFLELVLYSLVILFPAFLWYSHAHAFFVETGATFMWHYKGFSWNETLFSYYHNHKFWFAITKRISYHIFGYIGLLPFLLGFWHLMKPYEGRPLILLWLLGVLVFYMAIPGHNIYHLYYSIVVIPPLVLTAAIGAYELGRWIYNKWNFSPGWTFIFPVLMFCSGVGLMDNNDWYKNLYPYYDDAITLQSRIPKNALLAVMDEIPHTPEFFYFVQRKGWHQCRDARDGVDESPWIEEMKQKGATYYVGLTESQGNHPFLYLQNHITGQYLLSHYSIEDIGCRYFTARLDKPIYGDHLFLSYAGKTIAVAESGEKELRKIFPTAVPLTEWQKADAILLDFHLVNPKEIASWTAIYESALKEGFIITHQESGRIILERNKNIDAIPGFLSLVSSSKFYPAPLQEKRISLGLFEPGSYRISFCLEMPNTQNPLFLQVENQDGEMAGQRKLFPVHQSHIREGERPECFVTVKKSEILFASASVESKLIDLKSVVSMPLVQCIRQDSVIQAEELLQDYSRKVADSTADRGFSVYYPNTAKDRFACYGPYFQYPGGHYSLLFSLRSAQSAIPAPIKLSIIENTDQVIGSVSLVSSQVPEKFTDSIVDATFQENSFIEARALLPKETSLFIDTVKVRQHNRNLPAVLPSFPVGLVVCDGKMLSVTGKGNLINADQVIESAIPLQKAPIAKSAWNKKTGILLVDEKGLLFSAPGRSIWQIPLKKDEKIVALDISPDGEAAGVLTDAHRLFTMQSNKEAVSSNQDNQSEPPGVDAFIQGQHAEDSVPLSAFPLRDMLITGFHSALILCGNGDILTAGDAKPVKGIPNFGSDVLRALIRHKGGVYVVDSLGAIHSSAAIPPVKSPLYRPESWVFDALRTAQGEWAYLTTDGKILCFSEKRL